MVKDARSLSLSWHLRSPLQGRSHCPGRSLPDWLKEVRSLRGSVLFDNGRRRHFRTEEGRLFDADPIDLSAYHILVYDAMKLVGCVRVYRLVSNGFSCITEQILGEKTFSELLHKLGAQRTETVEIGRWVVHPAYRASGRPAVQLAAEKEWSGGSSCHEGDQKRRSAKIVRQPRRGHVLGRDERARYHAASNSLVPSSTTRPTASK
jgi:hypothetical protein